MFVGDRSSSALKSAYAREVRRGVLLSIVGLWILLVLDIPSIALQVLAKGSDPWLGFRVFSSMAVVLVLGVAGLANYVLAARSPNPLRWSAVFVVISLVMFLQVAGFGWLPPVLAGHYPRFLSVRSQDIAGLVFMLALAALPLSRALILWTGAAGAAVYLAANVAAISLDSGAHIYTGPFAGDPGALVTVMHPWTFVPDFLVLQLIAFALCTVLLALAIGRGESFIASHVSAEADRALLSRFFSPAVAREIVKAGGRIVPARRDVAVLFASAPRFDLERPDELARLGVFYAAVETIVFSHDGVVDRLAGGPVMATFGALSEDPRAAQKAIACALALRNATLPERPLLGLHFGDAVCGEAGTGSRRIFSVVGDTVNIAHRVCELAQQSDAGALATGALVARLPDSNGMVPAGDVLLRGRDGSTQLWRLAS